MLKSAVASLLLILVALGDQTFYVAAMLATRYSRWLIYVGATAALLLTTVLAVIVGKAVSVVPQFEVIHNAEIALFIGCGVRLLYQAARMPANVPDAIVKQAVDVVRETELVSKPHRLEIILKAFWLTFTSGWGNLSQVGTFALAISYNQVGVAIGAILGHGFSTVIAVVAGWNLARCIPRRTLTFARGLLFLCFGIAVLMQGE
ncbi:MAG: TMEM165/GDT1 family protein [Chroococcidiopsidaceae cyanobacterium CP_BM_ER_R8_30]|nr:TMEM165/GDT1 family protein [Chroococcidiopsidaceae cyanobacterium CP_BM_ER_R8_30]